MPNRFLGLVIFTLLLPFLLFQDVGFQIWANAQVVPECYRKIWRGEF